ncbi:hypothetical protein PINS_up016015 [Pythium insidiosum]|nr:hypothetical protein PINS_up016015 [Pythium insidiosum]
MHMPTPDVRLPAFQLPQRSILSSLNDHPQVLLALCNVIEKRAKPAKKEKDVLTKKWLRSLLVVAHSDKVLMTLQREGISSELIEDAKNGLKVFVQKVIDFLTDIEEIVGTPEATSIGGSIKRSLAQVEARLAPQMREWQERVNNAKSEQETHRNRLRGYLKRCERFADCKTYEEYEAAYIQWAGRNNAEAQDDEETSGLV